MHRGYPAGTLGLWGRVPPWCPPHEPKARSPLTLTLLLACLPVCALLLFPTSAAPPWGVGEVGNAPDSALCAFLQAGRPTAPRRGHSARTRGHGVGWQVCGDRAGAAWVSRCHAQQCIAVPVPRFPCRGLGLGGSLRVDAVRDNCWLGITQDRPASTSKVNGIWQLALAK
jgi:hypothetical protein